MDACNVLLFKSNLSSYMASKNSLNAKYNKWNELVKSIEAREVAEQLKMSMGKPLTEAEFKALQARRGGDKPTVINGTRPSG